MALGAYETTPLEMAGAYTIFANQGMYVKPNWVSSVRAKDGSVLYARKTETRQVLDPRVSYLMVNLLEEVMRSGRRRPCARGFWFRRRQPAPPDGWSPDSPPSCCVVWVGFDDNRELNLEGALGAAHLDRIRSGPAVAQYRDAAV